MNRPARVTLLAALLMAALPLSAAEPELTTALRPDRMTVGDRAELVVELRLPADVPPRAVSWPSWETHLGEAEILDTSSVDSSRDGAGRLLRQRLALTLFRTGSFALPEIAVEIANGNDTTTLTSSPGSLEVVSVLPPGEELPEPKPPAPPRPLELGMPFWWLLATGLGLCLAGIAWLIARSPRRETSRSPRPAPFDELSRAVAELRRESDLVAVHAGASLTLRRYLGRRLGFTAPESTTTEVDRALRGRRLEADLVRRTVELLTACDMVKFARRKVTEEETRDRLERLRALAARIEEWLEPESEAEGSEPRQPLAEAS